MIAEKLTNGGKRFQRVVFVGAQPSVKRKIKSALYGGTFSLNFIDDFEKAKQWLVKENYK
ncbi:MAG: hypothetical protein Q4G07_09690 [Oscillospiraceae bacterium]|nr:hypothetical protein [Oscillospiraceae bacterium]